MPPVKNKRDGQAICHGPLPNSPPVPFCPSLSNQVLMARLSLWALLSPGIEDALGMVYGVTSNSLNIPRQMETEGAWMKTCENNTQKNETTLQWQPPPTSPHWMACTGPSSLLMHEVHFHSFLPQLKRDAM